jgi:hypothetical protein
MLTDDGGKRRTGVLVQKSRRIAEVLSVIGLNMPMTDY